MVNQPPAGLEPSNWTQADQASVDGISLGSECRLKRAEFGESQNVSGRYCPRKCANSL